MSRVFTCLTGEHDWRLVILAGVVCFLTSLTAVSLFHRARVTEGRARAVWIFTAGAATGCGIWATHFIAMLAYDPGIAIGYDIGLTVLSLAAAVAVTSIGLTFALYIPARWGAPLGGGIVGAGVASKLLNRVGTRPIRSVGALITAGGVFWRSRIPVHGSYVSDLLPGMLLVGIGVTPMFVAVATAANAGVPAEKAGLAASLLNASQQLGGALGLAILTAIATSQTQQQLAAHSSPSHALVSGFQRGLFVGSIFLVAAAFIALRATNTRAETPESQGAAQPEPAAA